MGGRTDVTRGFKSADAAIETKQAGKIKVKRKNEILFVQFTTHGAALI